MKALLAVLKYPVAGALLAGGALGVAHYFGPDLADELGKDAGLSFAEGVASFQAKLNDAAGGIAVSGQLRRRRGDFR